MLFTINLKVPNKLTYKRKLYLFNQWAKFQYKILEELADILRKRCSKAATYSHLSGWHSKTLAVRAICESDHVSANLDAGSQSSSTTSKIGLNLCSSRSQFPNIFDRKLKLYVTDRSFRSVCPFSITLLADSSQIHFNIFENKYIRKFKNKNNVIFWAESLDNSYL